MHDPIDEILARARDASFSHQIFPSLIIGSNGDVAARVFMVDAKGHLITTIALGDLTYLRLHPFGYPLSHGPTSVSDLIKLID